MDYLGILRDSRGRSLAAALALAVTAGGCAADAEGPVDMGGGESGDINAYIRMLAPLPVDAPARSEGAKSEPVREGDYSCTTTNLSETRQYDEIVAYAANSESLWPGALLRGDSLYTGAFTQVVADRAPLRFSLSLENLAGAPSAEMTSPSLSGFRDSLNRILSNELTGDTPAHIYSEIEQVHSEEQLALAMGAGVSALGGAAKVSTSFDFNNQNIRSRYLVRYVQAYYTVDVDQPPSPSAFLADGVTLEEVSEKFGPENPPVYVSSITYGRVVVFTFESEYSGTEMGAALDFVYSGGADVNGNVSVTYKDIVARSNITAFILGGSGGDAAQTIDSYEALIDFIKSGGNYSRESPGAPIAYKLSYLSDNAPARLSFAQEYDVKSCSRVSQKVKVTLDSITVESDGNDGGSELELFGSIWAAADSEVSLLERTRDQIMTISEGETFPAVGILDEKILEVTPQPGNVISVHAALTDDDGLLNPDDVFPEEVFEASFDTGWRRTVDLRLVNGTARVLVTVSLEPI